MSSPIHGDAPDTVDSDLVPIGMFKGARRRGLGLTRWESPPAPKARETLEPIWNHMAQMAVSARDVAPDLMGNQ